MTEIKTTALETLRALDLPQSEFMVMGSGILEALSIRPANDVDLVVSDDLFKELADKGWREEIASNGSERLAHDIFQVYDRWSDEGEVKLLPELLLDAQWVDGVAFNSLQKLILYKHRRGMEKDLADLELINDYLNI